MLRVMGSYLLSVGSIELALQATIVDSRLKVNQFQNVMREVPAMELRRLLFERRIKQAAILMAVGRGGGSLAHSDLSKIVNGKMRAQPLQRLRIKCALIELGVPKREVQEVDELRDARPAHNA